MHWEKTVEDSCQSEENTSSGLEITPAQEDTALIYDSQDFLFLLFKIK